MSWLGRWLWASWELLADSSVYVLAGLAVGGLLKVFISPATVARHLGRGRITSVLKAALLGMPLPLCSCGVLPAAAALKRQGASNGATTAFLVSTPETGVDSVAITYALLGPIMMVARPIAAFATAVVAGVTENLASRGAIQAAVPDLSCPVDGCCDGADCPEAEHRRHHSLGDKLLAGLRQAITELWADLATWFMVGILLAGLITVLVPDDVMTRYLGGGWHSMLLMLVVGIPLYICATSSTPIAAAFMLKGVSPGAALVFLLAGPATNITSLSVLVGVLGRRATAIYLSAIAVMSVLSGMLLDGLYAAFGWSAQAGLGEASELVPGWLKVIGGAALLLLSMKPIGRSLRAKLGGQAGCDHAHDGHAHDQADEGSAAGEAGTGRREDEPQPGNEKPVAVTPSCSGST